LKRQPLIQGLVNYFSMAKAKTIMETLDLMARICLRFWKEWKN